MQEDDKDLPHASTVPAPPDVENKMKQRRGFAAMSAEKQRELASLGGKAAHAKGTAHEFSSEEARKAGRRGGITTHRNRANANNTSNETAKK